MCVCCLCSVLCCQWLWSWHSVDHWLREVRHVILSSVLSYKLDPPTGVWPMGIWIVCFFYSLLFRDASTSLVISRLGSLGVYQKTVYFYCCVVNVSFVKFTDFNFMIWIWWIMVKWIVVMMVRLVVSMWTDERNTLNGWENIGMRCLTVETKPLEARQVN